MGNNKHTWVAHTRQTVHYVADAAKAPALVQGSWGEPGCPSESHCLAVVGTAAAVPPFEGCLHF